MTPLRILFINQYFPPDTSATAQIASQIIAALAERHHVTVLAGRPSYSPTETHPYYLRRREQDGNVIVERVGSTGYFRGRMRQRVLNYFTYLALALPYALTIKTDVVIGMTDPPLAGVVGAVVARLKRKPFIYHIQDLHPDMALASEMVRPAGWVKGWEKLHRWVLRQADQIVVLGTDMRARVIDKGIPPERVHIVRSGAPVPETFPAADHPVIREIRGNFDFVLLHAGNLGFYGAWETLLKAADLLADENIGFVFIGDGASKETLEAMAGNRARVRFLPFFPAEDVPYVLASADVHIVTIRVGAEGVIVPSKLYPILAAGRPVLAVAPKTSDVAQIVTQSNCGVVVDPDDPAAVAYAIRNLFHHPAELQQMAQNARNTTPQFETRLQLEKLVKIIEQAAVDSGQQK